MHVSFTIPVEVFYALGAYFAAGIVLYVPLMYWMDKFISPSGYLWRDATVFRIIISLIACGVVWTYLVWDCLKNERKYGFLKR